jgi:Domain of unknown function (DUF4412)
MHERFMNVSALVLLMMVARAPAFEGRINATLTQDGQTSRLLYTAGSNELRIECLETNWPHCRDVIDLRSGAVMLVFPHNRSFVRLARVVENASMPAGFPRRPAGLPPGVGPQPPGVSAALNAVLPPSMPSMPNMPPGIGPQSAPGVPGMPAMPMMPRPMRPKAKLASTGETTNILGFTCSGYALKQRGETLKIWATDKLSAYHPYLQTQPPRSGPGAIVEPWSEALVALKLFPLSATLRNDAGTERLRFEVTSIAEDKISDSDTNLFQPPAGYQELEAGPL